MLSLAKESWRLVCCVLKVIYLSTSLNMLQRYLKLSNLHSLEIRRGIPPPSWKEGWIPICLIWQNPCLGRRLYILLNINMNITESEKWRPSYWIIVAKCWYCTVSSKLQRNGWECLDSTKFLASTCSRTILDSISAVTVM